MKGLRGSTIAGMILAGCASAQAADIKVISEKDLTIVSVVGELNFRDEETFTDKVLSLKDLSWCSTVSVAT